jgi:hypothetical protein
MVGGGGGTTIVNNINTIDAKSFSDALRESSGTVNEITQTAASNDVGTRRALRGAI